MKEFVIDKLRYMVIKFRKMHDDRAEDDVCPTKRENVEVCE